MSKRFRADQLLAFLFLLLGGFIYYQTFSFRAFVELNVPGPGVVPRAVALLMMALSLYVIVMSLLGKSPKPKPIIPSAVKPMVFSVVFGVLFVLLVPILGFYPLAFLLPLLFYVFVSDVENKRATRPLLTAVGFSVGLTLFLYLVFKVVLRMPLPRGVLLG